MTTQNIKEIFILIYLINRVLLGRISTFPQSGFRVIFRAVNNYFSRDLV